MSNRRNSLACLVTFLVLNAPGSFAYAAGEGSAASTADMLTKLTYLQPHPCGARVAAALVQRGVEPQRVVRLSYAAVNSNHFPLQTIGYIAKVGIDGEDRHLILNINENCFVYRLDKE